MLDRIKENPMLSKFKDEHPNANAAIIVLAVIMVWRGVWGLLDLYLFPGSPLLSYLLSIGLGFVILYLDGFSLENLKR